ncbi:hypothetical protein [Dasania marina]|uniref:rolling circle replication-associated protein n=1 Tax=Dasania marina TaxID=471499 RepID=UPI0030D7B306|tara:strand:+ start:73571 stop:74185 length:615 start_codon:yes stop_codon:yes gene_type:complete
MEQSMYETNSFKREYRAAFIRFISNQNNKYQLTITFKESTSDKECKKTINEMIRRLNQRLIGRNYINVGVYLSGFIVMERQKNGTLHFHSILNSDGGYLDDRDKLVSNLEKIRVKMVSNTRKTSRGNPLVLIGAKGGVSLDDYYKNNNKLEQYLTKNLEDPRINGIDTLGFWCADGAIFGDDSMQGGRRTGYLGSFYNHKEAKR